MIGIDSLIFVGLGALAGLIVYGTRARPLARFIPPLALVLIAIQMFTPLPVPTEFVNALIGAATVISVIRLMGGK